MNNSEVYEQESEQIVIGSLIYEPNLIDECKLHKSHFYFPEHKLIFMTLQEMQEQDIEIDVMSVTSRLQERNRYEQVQNSRQNNYVMELTLAVVSIASFTFFEKKVIESWRLRYSQKVARDLLKADDYNEVKNVLNITLDKLHQALDYGSEAKTSISESLAKVYNRILNGGIKGVMTGFKDIDRLTLGWQKKDLIIVGARPSVGKTAYVVNQINNQLDKPEVFVNLFSLEMAEELILQRMLGSIGRIDAHKLRSGHLNDNDWDKLSMAMGLIESKKKQLAIYDRMGMTAQEIRATVKQNMKEHPDKEHIVYIDYLTIMGYEGIETRPDLRVTDNTNMLKKMAKELDIPVVVLAQLTRGVEGRADKRPTMSDLRESGGIEQIADVIQLLYRDDYYDAETENKNMIEIITAKQRNGATGTVVLAFIKEYGLFLNIAHGGSE
jgi:replicative DNA helicase